METEDEATEARKRLGRLIEGRRELRGLTQRDVAKHSITYQEILAGQPKTERVMRRAFRTLGWDPNSYADALSGGDPRELEPDDATESDPIYAFEDAGAVFEGIAGTTDEERRIVLEILERGRRRLRERPSQDNE